ncbi:DSBA-like thioredoxin domain-containing protein [Coniella lustricola]|uniref:DSBA-like thioredoxin domain-containing protein n=1 Tax=Coniella lustricola TaxID=2025994 RepID=A0A2T3A1E3_9PEZI|nr:DSBA-like thioredoxin domain-containing protein [Coniella lustricola]
MTTFNINIVSDPICPFCYLGKKRLDRAISLYKKTVSGASADTFAITWKPYYLDPTLPQGKSTPVMERMTAKFGTDRLEALTNRLSTMGQSEGICFSFQGKMGNTRDAHRLIQLARLKDSSKGSATSEYQEKLMDALMKGYFEDGGDITSHEMLTSAAEKAGIDKSEAQTWLTEGKGGDTVDQEVEEAYARGIRGVPHFIINDKYEIGGAQDVEAFLMEFVRAKDTA